MATLATFRRLCVEVAEASGARCQRPSRHWELSPRKTVQSARDADGSSDPSARAFSRET